MLKYFIRFFINYKNVLFEAIFYEIIYSIKYLEFGSHLIINKKSKTATDSVPSTYYFVKKISNFIHNNNIKNVADLGCGLGRITNFLDDNTSANISGYELDKKIYQKSLKRKNKKVKLFNKNILDINFLRKNIQCYIMVDPFIKTKDTINLQKKIISSFKKNKNKSFFITVNIKNKLINKEFSKIQSIKTGKDGIIGFYYYKS
jgi:16S rRNA A1518/A1519 N6-dimethyltransferase RsmA/KsgA/DIM1 with predicted DNA glycosylase/AP lyase activity